MLDYSRYGALFVGLILTMVCNVHGQTTLDQISTAERQDGQGFVVRLHLSKLLDNFQLTQTNLRNINLKLDEAVSYPSSIKIEEPTYPFRDISVDSTEGSSAVVSIELAPAVHLKAKASQDRFSNDLLLGLSYVSNDSKYSSTDSLTRDMFDLVSPSSTFTPEAGIKSLDRIQKLFEQEFQQTNLYELKKEEFKAKIENEKNKIGLSVGTSYRENFGEGFAIGTGITYKRRAKVGLQWSFLDGGLFDSNYQIAKLKNKRKLITLNKEQSAKQDIYNQQHNAFIEFFNKQKMALLLNERKILKKQLEHARHFYHSKAISWEKVLEVMSNLEETKTQLKSYKRYNSFNTASFDSTIQSASLPMLNLKIEKLLNNIGTTLDEEIYQLKAKNIDRQNSVWRDINLNLSLDYNYYSGVGAGQLTTGGPQKDRGYLSAGLNLSFPLPLGFHSNEGLVKAKKEKLKYKNDRKQFTEKKQVLNHYYEYRHTLKQYLNSLARLKTLKEKIRTDRARWKMNNPKFSIPTLWSHINSLYNVRMEIIGIKQKAYLKLLKIYTYVHDLPITKMVAPIDQRKRYQKYNFDRSIYIWSETFDQYQNSFLVEYLRNIRIGEVMLSADDSAIQSGKAADFIKKMHQYNTDVYLLAGVNSLIKPERMNKLKNYAFQIDSLNYDGIHLDVEPHTFEDWEQRKDYYQQNYIKMLKQMSALLADSTNQLAVSVPVMYDQQFLGQIKTYANELCVMAYGTQATNEIKVRTETERQLTQITIALRTGDFKDRVTLESFMAILTNELGIEQIAIQDLAGLLNLDGEAINYSK